MKREPEAAPLGAFVRIGRDDDHAFAAAQSARDKAFEHIREKMTCQQ